MDFIYILPLEILEEIFLNLDSSDLIRCSCVSLRWREVINSNKIWSKRCAVEKILHKCFLRTRHSLFMNPTKMYKTIDSVSNRLTPTCYWRSHYNRYMYVKRSWRDAHYTILRTKVKTSHYKEGILINIEESRIAVHLIPEKTEIPYYIDKKDKYAMVDNVLLKDGHIIYTQSRYVACFKKINLKIEFLYEFEVERKRCKYQPFHNHSDKTLTAAVTDKFLFIQDNQNPCYLLFYHWTKGTLEMIVDVHKTLDIVQIKCPLFSCIETLDDKIYVSYTTNNKHYISQYNYTKSIWGITFETHHRAIQLIASNNFLCAKISDIAFEKVCELIVWSLHSKIEIALFCTNKNLPVILTQDDKIIYSENDNISIRGLITTFEKDMFLGSRLENMCLVWDKMLLINLGSSLQLWDWVKGLRLYTIIRDPISNFWVDDKLIVVSISRFMNSYSPVGGCLITYW